MGSDISPQGALNPHGAHLGDPALPDRPSRTALASKFVTLFVKEVDCDLEQRPNELDEVCDQLLVWFVQSPAHLRCRWARLDRVAQSGDELPVRVGRSYRPIVAGPQRGAWNATRNLPCDRGGIDQWRTENVLWIGPEVGRGGPKETPQRGYSLFRSVIWCLSFAQSVRQLQPVPVLDAGDLERPADSRNRCRPGSR